MPTHRTRPSGRTAVRTAVRALRRTPAGPLPRTVAAVLAAAVLAACSAGTPAAAPSTPAVTPSGTPSAAVTGDPAAPPGGAIQVVDPANRPTTRDDVRRNEAGVAWTLDDTGAQACAHAEFALRAVDEGTGDGADDLAEAQRLAGGSTTRALTTAVAGFPADPGRDDAAALLTACTTAGYEL